MSVARSFPDGTPVDGLRRPLEAPAQARRWLRRYTSVRVIAVLRLTLTACCSQSDEAQVEAMLKKLERAELYAGIFPATGRPMLTTPGSRA